MKESSFTDGQVIYAKDKALISDRTADTSTEESLGSVTNNWNLQCLPGPQHYGFVLNGGKGTVSLNY